MPNPIPDGFTAITPYLVIESPEAEIAFLKAVFDAQTITAIPGPDGQIAHAELSIAGARIMMGKAAGPHPPLPAMIYTYVPDADATFARATNHPGTTIIYPVTDMFYGDRAGAIKTQNNISWNIATHKEDVTPEQLAQRMQEAMKHKKDTAG